MGQARFAHVAGRDDGFNIELAAFKLGLTVEQGGLDKEQHFKNIVNALWGVHNECKKFVFHPWADRMLWAACNF